MQPLAYPVQPDILSQFWSSFMETGKVSEISGFAPDPTIIQSWERCAPRLSPLAKPRITRIQGEAFKAVLKAQSDLCVIAVPHIEDIHQFIEGSDCIIILTDGTACLLEMGGDQNAQNELNDLGLGRGAYWAEGQLGTTALGLALRVAMPVQVVGAEHYLQVFHHWISTAAPIHDVRGRIIGILAAVGPLESATSHTLGLVMSAARAISNQLQTNQYLIEANHRLSEVNALLASMNEGVIAWDKAGKITHINPQASKILRLDSAKTLGKLLTEALQVPPLIAEAIQSGDGLHDAEVRFEFANGAVGVLVSLQPLFEGTSRLVGYIAIIRPIEEVRQLVHQQVGTQALLTLADITVEAASMRNILRQAAIAARGQAPILLRGEDGVGKNSLGRAIHNASDRAGKPFITINCGAIPSQLMVAEFLGYDSDDEGRARPSKFELANGGTLFLDQIQSLSLEMQSALVQVMDTKHLMRLRSTGLIPIDVRIMASTSANLEQLVAEGSFTRQLYYAFGVFNFFIPPLRERPQDIPLLIEHFLHRKSLDLAYSIQIDDETLKVLCHYPWPGNVRELENALERAINHSEDGLIRIIDLPEVVRSGRVINAKSPTPQPIMTTLEAEREAIIRAGWACQGRVTQMAQYLGIGRTTLWRKLKSLNISPEQFK